MRFTVVTINGEDKAAELRAFAAEIGLEQAASGRYSIIFLLHLFGGWALRLLNPDSVIREINALEGIRGPSQTKSPAPLKHPPLAPLWHKNYAASGLRSMAINLRNELEKRGLPLFEKHVRETTKVGEARDMTEEDIGLITHEAVIGCWQRRFAAAEVTGDWIIYARHEEKNYYLGLSTHEGARDGGHEKLRGQIDDICCAEFPFLTTLLAGFSM
jgi:hypothetical protein